MSRKLTKHAMNGEVWKNGEDEMGNHCLTHVGWLMR
jgi:hypothetical protein